MSITAMNWALQQRLAGPSAQCLLYVVADSADQNGVARFARPDYLAERSRQSRATVFRRLDDLERLGLLTRFKHYSNNGAPIYEIRLHFEKLVDMTADDAEQESPSDEGAKSQDETLPESQSETTEVAPVRQPKSHLCDHIDPPFSKKDSPLPPQTGGARDAPLYRIEDFKAAYPIPITNWQRFEQLWRSMAHSECDDAITGARGYASFCRSQPRRTVEDAHRWIKNTKWTGYIVQGKTAETIAQRIEAEEGSTQWRIWKTVLKIARGSEELPAHWVVAGSSGKRAKFPKALPETLIELAHPNRGWADVVEGDGGHFAAWKRWLHEMLPENFIVIPTVQGKRRFSTPDIWPPRKDGSIGPPQEKSDAA